MCASLPYFLRARSLSSSFYTDITGNKDFMDSVPITTAAGKMESTIIWPDVVGSAIGVILILASVDVSISLVSVFCFSPVFTVVVVDVVVVVGALQYKGEISVNINFRYVSRAI